MRTLLRAIRFLRVLPKWVFGRRAPKFLSGLYDLVKFANLFELLPTLTAVIFYPRHFFRRIPRALAGKGPLLDPLRFVLSTATYSVLAVVTLYPKLAAYRRLQPALDQVPPAIIHGVAHVTQTELYVGMGILALLTPLWILPVCALTYSVLYITEGLLQSNLRTVEQARSYRRRQFELLRLLAPFSPDVYARLDKGRFFWSLCYFGIAAFLLVQIVAAAFAVGLHTLSHSDPGTLRFPPLSNYVLAFSLLIPATISEFLLLRPYIELLNWSCWVPPIPFHRVKCATVRVASETLLKDLHALRGWRERWTTDKFMRRHSKFDEARTQLIDAAIASSNQLEVERCKARTSLLRSGFDFRNAGAKWLKAGPPSRTREGFARGAATKQATSSGPRAGGSAECESQNPNV